MKYDIFLSYRRKDGSERAELLKAIFLQNGYKNQRIFMDTHSIHSGDFKDKIDEAIAESCNVVVVITKGSFDDIKGNDYWIYEIEKALELKKNIIPVIFDGVDSLNSKDLPQSLKELQSHNAITYSHEYADAFYQKLITFLKEDDNIPSKKPVPFTTRAIDFIKKNKTVIILCSIIFTMFVLLLSKDEVPEHAIIIDDLTQTAKVDASQQKSVTETHDVTSTRVAGQQPEKVLPTHSANTEPPSAEQNEPIAEEHAYYTTPKVVNGALAEEYANYITSRTKNAILINEVPAEEHAYYITPEVVNEALAEEYAHYISQLEQRTNTTRASKQPTAGKEIDLGLSVNWSSCNLGASKPEEFGNYYAWGETEEKNKYYEENYFNADTKSHRYYNLKAIMPDISGTRYDAARAIMGGRYRIPTREEMEELVLNCKWEYSVINGIEGMLVTGSTGNSIFIPKAGSKEGLSHNSLSQYWTSTATKLGISAYSLYISVSRFRAETDIVDFSNIYRGLPIRPVISK